MSPRARTIWIWITGVLASMIVGGLLGDRINPYGPGGFFGVLAGPLIFTCARLWTGGKPPKSD